jgi:hypothetical protein
MRRVVKTIGGYEVHFEPEEVNTVEKITKLIEKKIIDTPGMLIDAIIAVQNSKGLINCGKQADAFEEKLMKEFNHLKAAYYNEFKLLERDDVNWKEVNEDLLVIASEDLFAKYI